MTRIQVQLVRPYRRPGSPPTEPAVVELAKTAHLTVSPYPGLMIDGERVDKVAINTSTGNVGVLLTYRLIDETEPSAIVEMLLREGLGRGWCLEEAPEEVRHEITAR